MIILLVFSISFNHNPSLFVTSISMISGSIISIFIYLSISISNHLLCDILITTISSSILLIVSMMSFTILIFLVICSKIKVGIIAFSGIILVV